MPSPASAPGRPNAFEDLLFAIGLVAACTTRSLQTVAISGDVLSVPRSLWAALILVGQGLPAALIVLLLWWLERRPDDRAARARVALAAAASLFLLLRVAGPRFEHVASSLTGGLPRWTALAVYLVLVALAAFALFRLVLRYRRGVVGTYRWFGIPGAVLSVLMFIVLSSTAGDQSIYAPAAPVPLAAPSPGALHHPPVFILIFDELSNQVLLDDRGRIDHEHYPNLARLADQGVVFTNAQSNFFNTSYAIPSLAESLLPVTAVGELRLYPQYRDVEVALEPFCAQPTQCVGISEVARSQRGTIVRHLLTAYATNLIPPPFEAVLRGPVHAAADALGVPVSAVDTSGIHILDDAFADRFIDDLSKAPLANSVTVFHSLSTHHPFVSDVGGAGDHPFHWLGARGFEETAFRLNSTPPAAASDIGPAWLLEAYQAQARNGDRILGRILDALDEQGLLDESIVILTADHGQRPTFPAPDTPIEVDGWTTNIPLIIHAPGLLPGASTASVQFRDIAPTVFDLLDLDVDPSPDTLSAFATDRPARTNWFIVSGTWIHHQNSDGRWDLVGALPDQLAAIPPGAELPTLNSSLFPCFSDPEACDLPILLPGTPEFEAAIAQ